MAASKAGKRTLIALDVPDEDRRWEATVEPITGGEESRLRYEHWVEHYSPNVE